MAVYLLILFPVTEVIQDTISIVAPQLHFWVNSNLLFLSKLADLNTQKVLLEHVCGGYSNANVISLTTGQLLYWTNALSTLNSLFSTWLKKFTCSLIRNMYMTSLSDNLDNLGTQTTQSKPTLEIIRKWFIKILLRWRTCKINRL